MTILIDLRNILLSKMVIDNKAVDIVYIHMYTESIMLTDMKSNYQKHLVVIQNSNLQ